MVSLFPGFLTIFPFGYQFFFFFVLWYYRSRLHMSAPDSKDLQWHRTITSLQSFTHTHTHTHSPGCLTLHCDSRVGISLVIHCFKVIWFMSAFTGKDKATSQFRTGQNMLNHGDDLPAGADTILQCFWKLSEQHENVLLFNIQTVWSTNVSNILAFNLE